MGLFAREKEKQTTVQVLHYKPSKLGGQPTISMIRRRASMSDSLHDSWQYEEEKIYPSRMNGKKK